MNRAGIAIGGFRGRRGRSLARLRRARRPRRVIVTTLAAVLSTLGLAGAGTWWTLTSPSFAISRVESGPYRFSVQAEVDAVLRSFLGRNIWTLELQEVSAAFADLPWVRSVHLRRRVPQTLTVELDEWRPLLSVAVGDGAPDQVLIADGRLLSWPDHLQPPGLPVLVGAPLQPGVAEGGQALDPEVAAAVLAAIDALVVTGFEAAYPVDFLRLTPLGLVLELERRAGRVVLGRGDYAPRLQRFLLARDRVPAGSTVDLRFADRITFETPASAVD